MIKKIIFLIPIILFLTSSNSSAMLKKPRPSSPLREMELNFSKQRHQKNKSRLDGGEDNLHQKRIHCESQADRGLEYDEESHQKYHQGIHLFYLNEEYYDGLDLLIEAANLGSIPAQIELAKIYYKNEEFRNLPNALHFCKIALNNCAPTSQQLYQEILSAMQKTIDSNFTQISKHEEKFLPSSNFQMLEFLYYTMQEQLTEAFRHRELIHKITMFLYDMTNHMLEEKTSLNMQDLYIS